MTLEAIILCLALNVFYEANNEPLVGKQAVAHVTLNRVNNENYPDNVCSVVYQPGQFSWTNEKGRKKPSRAALEKAKEIAEDALEGRSTDPTMGATHFHNLTVKPRWKLKRIIRIGNHIFYA